MATRGAVPGPWALRPDVATLTVGAALLLVTVAAWTGVLLQARSVASEMPMEPEAGEQKADQPQDPQCPQRLPRLRHGRRGEDHEHEIDRVGAQRRAPIERDRERAGDRQGEADPNEPVEPVHRRLRRCSQG